jgi:hypothetical protein
MTQFDFKFEKLNIYRLQLDNFTNSPAGPVGSALAIKGRLIVAMAKRMVGFQTGKLRDSIHMRHTRAFYGQKLEIGSSVNYALAHHEGTKPHEIVPKQAQILRFSSGGRIIYSHHVNHPGTKPNPYLTTPLRLIIHNRFL